MSFSAHARRAMHDAVAHVGQRITVSMCGVDSFNVCGIYWRRSTEMFNPEAGMTIESSTHWLLCDIADFDGHRFPRSGDELIVEDKVFVIAEAPKADLFSVRMRLHVSQADDYAEPGFGAY
ncbi:MAG: hypothetical protein ACOYB0_08210 [Polynucleobacter sp.]